MVIFHIPSCDGLLPISISESCLQYFRVRNLWWNRYHNAWMQTLQSHPNRDQRGHKRSPSMAFWDNRFRSNDLHHLVQDPKPRSIRDLVTSGDIFCFQDVSSMSMSKLFKVIKICQFWTKRPKSPSRDHLPEKPRHCGYPILNAVLQYKVGHQSRLQTYPSLQIPSSHTTPGDQVPVQMLQQPWLPRIFTTSCWVVSRMTNAVPQMPPGCFLTQHVFELMQYILLNKTRQTFRVWLQLANYVIWYRIPYYDFMIDV